MERYPPLSTFHSSISPIRKRILEIMKRRPSDPDDSHNYHVKRLHTGESSVAYTEQQQQQQQPFTAAQITTRVQKTKSAQQQPLKTIEEKKQIIKKVQIWLDTIGNYSPLTSNSKN
ncbi:unnamed protein product [Didymodactylos carnosus]|uniref:Uncharacterized protein n=1 Tax=Didymodactylos carnosus TaxID=1234261 RepID=A0A813Y5J2_9BILA|nr:unnamed protein product [Didymodactylos carnosus]CAF1181042.1 unnamed protein product [Didymodactylos carnosus]CAF3664862.1 unnamed protein product [Didymodactylos carnosus]CAF3992263.1 unnamed protein product [Didymodactylos carnosus]